MLNLAVHTVTHPDQPLCPPCLLCDSIRSFPGVQQPECVDDHPPPSSASLHICRIYIPPCALCGFITLGDPVHKPRCLEGLWETKDSDAILSSLSHLWPPLAYTYYKDKQAWAWKLSSMHAQYDGLLSCNLPHRPLQGRRVQG
jgi:hypothetical protein